MAIDFETYTEIAAALGTSFGKQLFHQFNRTATALAMLPATPATNKVPAWDVEFSGVGIAAAYAEGSDILDAEYSVDLPVPAVLGWGLYRKPFALTELEMEAALASKGSPDLLTDILEDRMETTMSNLASVINKDVFDGDGTDASGFPTIVGFFGGALGASGSYAGIARGTYAEHSATVLGNGGTPRILTTDLLYQAEEQIFRKCGRNFDMILGSTGVRRKYAGIFEDGRRVITAEGNAAYNAGSRNLMFQGAQVMRDKDATAGKLILGVSEFVDVQFLVPIGETRDTVMSRMRQLSGSAGEPNAPVTATAIPVKVTPLAKTGNNVKFNLSVSLQMRVRRCNAFCVIEDISET